MAFLIQAGGPLCGRGEGGGTVPPDVPQPDIGLELLSQPDHLFATSRFVDYRQISAALPRHVTATSTTGYGHVKGERTASQCREYLNHGS